MLAFILNSNNLKKKAASWIDDVLSSQEDDGYIGGYDKDDDRRDRGDRAGSIRLHQSPDILFSGIERLKVER